MVNDWILFFTALSVIVLVFTLIALVYQEETRSWIDLALRKTTEARVTRLVQKVDGTCSDYSVHQTSTLDELTEVWKIDCAAYGEANVSFAILQAWWQLYPQGHYIIKKRGKIIGGFGIWPVAKDTYHHLRRGTLTEDKLTIMGRRNSKARKEHWYISGIVIAAAHRKTRAPFCLLNQVVEHWCISQVQSEQLQIGAIPISEEGLRLLVRHGFSMATDAERRNNHHPFYERVYRRQDIDPLLQGARPE